MTGAPVAAPRGAVPAAATTLKVKAALEGNGPAKAWFGAQPHRTLVLDVTNPGATARSPVLELQVGKGDKPTTAAPAPDLGTLAPGETRTYKIPVELDAFAVGGYSARGVLRGDGDPVAFKASTGTFPWGLLAGGLLVVQLVLLAVRDRARRRLVPAAEPAVADEPQHEPAVAAVAVRNPTATTVAVPRRAPRPPVIIVRRVVEPEPEPEFEPEPDAEPVGPFFEPVAVCTRRPAPQDAVREPDGARVPPPWAAWPKAAAPAALSELRELADAWGPTTVESAEVDLTVPVVPVVGSFLPVSQHALLRMGHESLQALESVDPLAYWASPLLTLRASKRAHLTPLREAS